jgi:outer membrane immunogenic protein
MKIKLLVAAAATVVASSAMAQSAFQGFYGQVGVGYEHNQLSSGNLNVSQRAGEPDSGTPGAVSSPSYNASSFSGAITVGYNASIAPKFLLGLGIDYNPLTSTSSNTPICSAPACATAGVKYDISNRFNVYLTPGYEIDKDKLVYLKAGYTMQNVKAKPQFDGVPSTSANANGFILGLGYKQLLDKNLYLFGEGNYMNYSKTTLSGSDSGQSVSINQTPIAYQFLVGVGYKF